MDQWVKLGLIAAAGAEGTLPVPQVGCCSLTCALQAGSHVGDGFSRPAGWESPGWDQSLPARGKHRLVAQTAPARVSWP